MTLSWDYTTSSSSASFRSFLLIMCIDAPESTTGTYFPETRRMLLFGALLILIHFWPTSTLLRGHLALATLSLLVMDPQILECWAALMEVHLGWYNCEWLKETDSEHFSRFGRHKKNDHCCFLPQRVAPFYRPRPQETRQLHRRRCQGRWGKEAVSRVFWRHPSPWAYNLLGCDTIQTDHAPDGETVQKSIHGVVIKPPW